MQIFKKASKHYTIFQPTVVGFLGTADNDKDDVRVLGPDPWCQLVSNDPDRIGVRRIGRLTQEQRQCLVAQGLRNAI